MYLGIEIGGTKLQAAVGHADQLSEVIRRPVDVEQQAAGIRDQLKQIVPELVSRHAVEAVGIGFGGPVDTARGIVTTSHQVSGWEQFPLGDWMRKLANCRCRLANDCDAAALAEARFGAGRAFRRVLYVTVGTGVGGGWVVDGKLDGQDRPACLEIGHLRPGLNARTPQQTVESEASGMGIETRLAALVAAGSDDPDALELRLGSLSENRRPTAQAIFQAAAEGNGLALEVISNACRVLGWAVAQAATLLAPDVVILGGGVSLAGEKLFFEPVREAASDFAFPPLAGTYDIVPARLGEEVVLYGALAAAADAANQ